MKKVLVTGAAGFIGSHLVEGLTAAGHEVRAFVHYNSRNDWGWLETVSCRKEIEVVTGDIRDYDSVLDVAGGCDTVYHLAALIGIPYSYVSPLAYIKTNVEGTYNVLQAARQLRFKKVLVTSTSETYGTARYVPMDEEHPLTGQSPYSATKIGADQLALSYYRSFGLPVKVVRPFNTYGPRQSARAIIPSIIIQLLEGKKTIRLGNLSPTRDLVFVKDTVAGFQAIAQSPKTTGTVTNICTGSEISIGDLVRTIGELMGVSVRVATDRKRVRPGKSEVERLCGTADKIGRLTGWKPRRSLKTGLKQTITWLKKNRKLYKPGVYNV